MSIFFKGSKGQKVYSNSLALTVISKVIVFKKGSNSKVKVTG